MGRTAALRFFRTCLRLNNNNLLNHLKKHQVFLPILKLTHRESKRDNLLSSCCQEMFEAMRRVRLFLIAHSGSVSGCMLMYSHSGKL
jgi:hypothetical protein